jgi:hypothetical protein
MKISETFFEIASVFGYYTGFFGEILQNWRFTGNLPLNTVYDFRENFCKKRNFV